MTSIFKGLCSSHLCWRSSGTLLQGWIGSQAAPPGSSCTKRNMPASLLFSLWQCRGTLYKGVSGFCKDVPGPHQLAAVPAGWPHQSPSPLLLPTMQCHVKSWAGLPALPLWVTWLILPHAASCHHWQIPWRSGDIDKFLKS